MSRKELLAIRSALGFKIEIGVDQVQVEELRVIHAYGEKPRIEIKTDSVWWAYFHRWQGHAYMGSPEKRDVTISVGTQDLWVYGAWPHALSINDLSITLRADNHQLQKRLGVPV